MIELNFIDDGCSLSQREILNMTRMGLGDGPVATASEFSEALREVPDEGRAPVVSDQGLMLLAMSQHSSLEKCLAEGDRLSTLTVDELESEALKGNALAALLFRRLEQKMEDLMLYGDGTDDNLTGIIIAT